MFVATLLSIVRPTLRASRPAALAAARRALATRMGDGDSLPAGFREWREDDAPPALDADADVRVSGDFGRAPPPRLRRPAEELAAALEVPDGVCQGCGSKFQAHEESLPGYVPEHVLEGGAGRSAELKPKAVICQRCHGLRYKNALPTDALRVRTDDASPAELRPERFRQLLRGIARKRCVVVAIVDVFDFHGSLVPDLPQMIGDENPLVLVANKADLLPPAVSAAAVERWVRAECRSVGLPAAHSLHLVSCKTGGGLPPLLEKLEGMMSKSRMDAYVVGAANAGKSTFINHCLKAFGSGGGGKAPKGEKRRAGHADDGAITTSHLPGTTLGFVRVSMLAGRQSLYDSPGIVLPGQLTSLLDTEELADVVPKKRADHATLRLGEGRSVLLGGLARVHMRAGRPFLFTFYLANAVPVHPTATAKVAEVVEKHAGGLLAPPSAERLEAMGEFEEHVFEIDGRGWDEAAVDVVIPGLGWVSVTGSGSCTVSVEAPRPTAVVTREPLVAVPIRETRKTLVKFTGSKLTNKRGKTMRRKGAAKTKAR